MYVCICYVQVKDKSSFDISEYDTNLGDEKSENEEYPPEYPSDKHYLSLRPVLSITILLLYFYYIIYVYCVIQLKEIKEEERQLLLKQTKEKEDYEKGVKHLENEINRLSEQFDFDSIVKSQSKSKK